MGKEAFHFQCSTTYWSVGEGGVAVSPITSGNIVKNDVMNLLCVLARKMTLPTNKNLIVIKQDGSKNSRVAPDSKQASNKVAEKKKCSKCFLFSNTMIRRCQIRFCSLKIR